MRIYAFTLFETKIGFCGLVWSRCGIAGVQLPESCEAVTRRRVIRRFPEALEETPPADIGLVRDAIKSHFDGDRADLFDVALDMGEVPEFHRRVYEQARKIPTGETLTYGALARKSGADGAARAVGQALARNPFPILVPCHRIVAAGGKLGGFSAHGGLETKRRMLEIERLATEAPHQTSPSPGRRKAERSPTTQSSPTGRSDARAAEQKG
jgi:methylated-DNA-[protein]-cysteine S-methyltransferase